MIENSAHARAETVSKLRENFGVPNEITAASRMSFGIPEIDLLIGGLPGGAITEVVGERSSGRTTLMLSALSAISKTDLCALVDASNCLDVVSAETAGIDLHNFLWTRCGSDVDCALKVTELLLRSGLFALVVLDLGNVPFKETSDIQSACWVRFRLALENSSNALLVIGQQSLVHSLAGLVLRMNREESDFSVISSQKNKVPAFTNLLNGVKFKTEQQRPFAINTRTDFYASVPFR
jgi:hypothetical protein